MLIKGNFGVTDVSWFLTDDFALFVKLCVKYKGETPPPLSDETVGRTSGVVMWVRNLQDTPVLVHECTHLVDFWMEYFGFGCGELRAYMIQKVLKKILDRLKKEEHTCS